jgi:hypothetical protein
MQSEPKSLGGKASFLRRDGDSNARSAREPQYHRRSHSITSTCPGTQNLRREQHSSNELVAICPIFDLRSFERQFSEWRAFHETLVQEPVNLGRNANWDKRRTLTKCLKDNFSESRIRFKGHLRQRQATIETRGADNFDARWNANWPEGWTIQETTLLNPR